MEPPPPPLSATTTTTTTTAPVPNQTYPESLDSTPRSRHTDSWDDPPAAAAAALSSKLRLMCSYGGHIVPRPHDKSLCYVGGETRIIVVDRNVSLSSLSSRLSQSLLNGRSFVLKYQLPSEDLDSLISVTTDEDLENMIEEYERTSSNCQKPCRLRLFLFQQKPESTQSFLEGSAKSDEWFLSALNGTGVLNRGFSDSASVNCLLGLDEDIAAAGGGGGGGSTGGPIGGGGSGGSGVRDVGDSGLQKKAQEVQSVPDSPMMETTSSFGSSSSSPSLANLPPIRVHVDDPVKVQDQKIAGIEEQFAQINVSKQQEDGFMVMSSPPPPPPTGVAVVPGEYINRVISDDERSDHGVPLGYRKAPPPPQPQQHLQQLQPQQKSGGAGGIDLPSPDSVSSDSSLSNSQTRQKPVMYQDQLIQIQPGTNRVFAVDANSNLSDQSNIRVHHHIQQQHHHIQDSSNSGYILQAQMDHQTQQQNQNHQQQQQQFIHPGAHYIQHQPMPAYYPVYPSQHRHQQQHQQQQQQQYPVYYIPTGQPQQGYNTISEAPPPTQIPSNRPQTPPNPAMVPHPMRTAHMVKQPEMGPAAGVYRTTTAGTATPQLVQMGSGQQYVGYSQQIHHPSSQSVAPQTSAAMANANYGYEFADPSHPQIYYTQPLAPGPTMASQYQTMTEASAQIPNESMKQQQQMKSS